MNLQEISQQKLKNRIGVRSILFCAALFLFFLIAFAVVHYGVTSFDQNFCGRVYAMRNDALTAVLTTLTYLGNWQTVTLICIVLLFFQPSRRHFGVPLATAAILSTTLYEFLKRVFERPRPGLSLHLIDQGGFSFPSGHAMTGLVFYGLLIVLLHHHMEGAGVRRLFTVLLALLILTIGFSRVYLGVHYPTDILGGWCLGFCILTAFDGELNRRWAARKKYALS